MITFDTSDEMYHRVFNNFIFHHAPFYDNYSIQLMQISHELLAAGSYRIQANIENNVLGLTIHSNETSGFRYALNSLHHWLKTGPINPLDTSDCPQFLIRGVIEGFYGKPWTHQQRMRSLDYFGDFGLNSYFIAPKDAPWQRFNWRAPFNRDFLNLTQALVERGAINGIDVSICVSPGLSVKYSDDADVDAVITRFKQLYDIGVTHFGLLWDDISWELQHEEDLQKYPTTSIAHADFSNRIYSQITDLDINNRLSVCPMHYNGRGVIPYIEELGSRLHSNVNLMWTGRQICSEYLDISDALVFEKSAHRKPLYWDNFPVNDGSMQSNLHIGPIRGREKGLHNYSVGLLSNPMLQGEASLLPIATIGEYLWNSEKYIPEVSWEKALESLIPDTFERGALRDFYRTSLGSTVGGDPAPDLRKVFNKAVSYWRAGDVHQSANLFEEAGKKIEDNFLFLTSDNFTHKVLISEICEWLEKYRLGGEVLVGVSKILRMCSFDKEKKLITGPDTAPKQISELLELLQTHKKRLFGDQIEGPFNELIAELSG